MSLRAMGLVFLMGACVSFAQTQLTVAKLVTFVRSSIQLRHPDKQVASYLARVKLAEKLDDRTIEELQGDGAGPKTVEALRALRDLTASMPVAQPAAPKPVPAQIPPPDAVEQARILDEVRQYALNYSKNLPDFICTQVTRRYVDPTGLEFWTPTDTFTAKLSFFEQKEDYKLILVNNVYTQMTMDQIGGTTSSGEFGTLLREIFERESNTRFQWERWATLRGRRNHVFTYAVEQARSKWRISYERTQEILTAYTGLVYVDRDTGMISRITMEATDIPRTFPIQAAGTVLDYDFTKISDQEFLLPLKAVTRLRHDKYLTKNETEFRMYRKFGSESTITFTPDPLPEDQTKEQQVAPPPAPKK